MATVVGYTDLNEDLLDSIEATRRRKCHIGIYQLSRYQVGGGASSVGTPTASLKLLGAPLEIKQYGRFDDLGVLDTRDIYANENTLLTRQATAPVFFKSVTDNKLVNIIVLNEFTANGQSLDEIGLFVDNPFMKETPPIPVRGGRVPTYSTVSGTGEGGSIFGGGGQASSDVVGAASMPTQTFIKEKPGSMLAAYKQFPRILKEDFFSLIFRWSISFKPEC